MLLAYLHEFDRFADIDALGVVAGFGAVLCASHERGFEHHFVSHELLDAARRRLIVTARQHDGDRQAATYANLDQSVHDYGTLLVKKEHRVNDLSR